MRLRNTEGRGIREGSSGDKGEKMAKLELLYQQFKLPYQAN